MTNTIKPILLLADSQLLFWKSDNSFLLQELIDNVENTPSKAIYLGASNGDNPKYYEIFEAAMNNVGITQCKMLCSPYSNDDQCALKEADLILLAGGDVATGWHAFEQARLSKTIQRRYYEGAQLIGVSAGAVQLGLGCFTPLNEEWLDTLALVPCCIMTHEETNDWGSLHRAANVHQGGSCLGIPAGGGMLFYADHTVSPVRFPLIEIRSENEESASFLLMDSQSGIIEHHAPEHNNALLKTVESNPLVNFNVNNKTLH
jgi:peptidase E